MLKLLRTAGAVLMGLLFVPALALAAAAPPPGIVQSYNTDATVRQGMIVGTKAGDTATVEPLSASATTQMLGVAISASDAPITLSNGATSAQVYVATSGTYNVLVSDQNGVIHKGDFISISSLNGIGMKAEDSEPTVLGTAAADMTKASVVEGSVSVKTGRGGTMAVNLALIPVAVGVGTNPNEGHGTGNLPGFLQIASNTIANKPVSAVRVYLGLAVLLLTAFIAGSLLFSGVRNSITSIGRNPLAKPAITRGLLQVVLTGIIIFLIGLFAVYLLLRL